MNHNGPNPGPGKSERASAKLPLKSVVDRNIRTLAELKQANDDARTLHQRLVSQAVALVSSVYFLYANALLTGLWLLDHFGLFGARFQHFFRLERVAEFASLEAIFLSTLVLINQKSMARLEERRDDLNLQMNLITEHEITRILNVVDLIAKELKINTAKVADLADAKNDISPEMVLSRIEKIEDRGDKPKG